MVLMAELLIKDKYDNEFLLISKDNEIYLSKMVFDDSGFIFYESINHHDIGPKDIHSLIYHEKCDDYELVSNLKDKSLPLHILEL